MSFTSDYLKKKEQLQSNQLQQGAPRFTLPTTSAGVVQKASTVQPATKPAATSSAAGSSVSQQATTQQPKIGMSNLVSGVSDRLQEIRDSAIASGAQPLPSVGNKRQSGSLLDDIKWGLGYGTERIGSGLLGAVEGVSDFVGSTGSKALEYLTSFVYSRPNDVSEFFRQQAENYLNTSPTEQYRQSIEQRYQPTDAQRALGSLNETVAAMLPSLGAAALTGGGSAAGQLASGVSGASKALTGSNLGRTLLGVQAAGGGAQEAYQEGADIGEALTFGAASGALEAATEALVGGIPGLGKGAASELVEKVVSNPAVRKAIDIAGEGGEEAISTIVTPFLKRAIYDTSAENASLDEIVQSAIMGMAAAGVLQAGVELPSAISNRADITRQANANLNNPEFVQRTTDEAVQNINRNLNRQQQPFTLPSVEAQNSLIPSDVSNVVASPENRVQAVQNADAPVLNEAEALLPEVNGPESSVGAARKGFDPWSAFQGTKSEFFPEGANAARPVDVPTTDAQGNPIRKTASTAMGAKAIPDEVVGEIQNMIMAGDLSYARVTDQDSVNRAVRTIEADGFQRSMEKFTSAVQKGVVSKDLATLGQQLLVNAANARDSNATAELLTLYAQMETTAGQAVQAASILRKLEPTAQLYAAQRAASNLEQTISKQLKGQNITIDPALIDEFNQQTDQAGRDVVLDKIYKNIADQVPANWKDKWNAWRYLAMLGNPRTHIRNIVGNVGFQPVRFTKDRIAALIEAGVSAASGGKLQRTKSFVYSPELYTAAWQDYDNVADVLSGNKYDDVQSIINDKRTIFKNKALEAARRGNSNLLSFEDMWFKRITYAGALAGYLNANGVTVDQFKNGTVDSALLSAARDYAGQEALKATYNDKNVVSNKVVQAAKSLGTFGEAVLPFKRTPANILVRGVEYSPIGLAKGLTYDLYKVKNGEMTGAQAIDNIAAGMTGSGLMLLGALLAAAGVVTGGAGDDEKQAEWNELTGGQTYALSLPGGGSVTLDWLAPEALPFFMGVQAMQSFGEEGLTGDTITSAFASISEPMLEMSMLQSLNDLIDNVSYAASNEKLSGLVGSSLISYLTQAIPTIGGQIERTLEDKRYSTYTNKDSLIPTDVQYALGKASAKIPGWDYQQVPFIDAWGREEETGLLPMRALNNFLNPAYTSSMNVTPVDAEIQRLYNATGTGSVVPSRADRSITVDGEKVELTGDQYVEYATTKGQTAFDLLSSIIDTSAYKKLSDTEKTKLISEVYEYANSVGKAAVSSYKPDGSTAKIQQTGVDPADYILYKSTADADRNGTVTQSESAVALLPMKNLTTAEKGKVWQSQNSSWSEKKNPFTGALASAGIDASTATSILDKYTEVYNMDIKSGDQAAELSKFLDGLDLTNEQRAVVDDTYKFYTMFPAKATAYSIDTMSDAAQAKWPRVQAWGLSEEDYLKYYPMVSSGKKADCLQKLQDAGMTAAQANYFWTLVKNK